MLNTEHVTEYLAEVKAKAEELGKLDNLNEQLEWLGNYACHDDPEHTQCVLYKDFAPLSFEFVMLIKRDNGEYDHWFNGGLIFHGQHDRGGDGGLPTLSVCLTPQDGWSVHT